MASGTYLGESRLAKIFMIVSFDVCSKFRPCQNAWLSCWRFATTDNLRRAAHLEASLLHPKPIKHDYRNIPRCECPSLPAIGERASFLPDTPDCWEFVRRRDPLIISLFFHLSSVSLSQDTLLTTPLHLNPLLLHQEVLTALQQSLERLQCRPTQHRQPSHRHSPLACHMQ